MSNGQNKFKHRLLRLICSDRVNLCANKCIYLIAIHGINITIGLWCSVDWIMNVFWYPSTKIRWRFFFCCKKKNSSSNLNIFIYFNWLVCIFVYFYRTNFQTNFSNNAWLLQNTSFHIHFRCFLLQRLNFKIWQYCVCLWNEWLQAETCAWSHSFQSHTQYRQILKL